MAKEQRSREELEALKPKFFEAIDAGLSASAAAAAVGVHAQTGVRWKEVRETGAVDAITAARERRAEMVKLSYDKGVAVAAKKFKTTISSVYSARYQERGFRGELDKPPPTAKGKAVTNGHAPEPAAPKAEATARKQPARAEALEVSAVTTATAFSATMKVMQILEPLAEADRARVAKAVLIFVQGGIG